MNTQQVKNVVLTASLVLNVVLGASMFWLGVQARQAMMKFVADAAGERIAIQEKILKDLESPGKKALEELKENLRWDIDAQNRIRYKVDTEKK
ncbi:MAG: hypothetical protein V1873_06120 [Verrucomicrobiota bacterium]